MSFHSSSSWGKQTVQIHLFAKNTSPTLNKHQLIPAAQQTLGVYTEAGVRQQGKNGICNVLLYLQQQEHSSAFFKTASL